MPLKNDLIFIMQSKETEIVSLKVIRLLKGMMYEIIVIDERFK